MPGRDTPIELGNKREWLTYHVTEKLADKALKDFNKSLIKGDVEDCSETFGQFIDYALASIYKPKLKGTTYTLYKGLAKNHLKTLRNVKLPGLDRCHAGTSHQ